MIEMHVGKSRVWQPLPARDGELVVAVLRRRKATLLLGDNAPGDPEAICPPIVFGELMRYRVRVYRG